MILCFHSSFHAYELCERFYIRSIIGDELNHFDDRNQSKWENVQYLNISASHKSMYGFRRSQGKGSFICFLRTPFAIDGDTEQPLFYPERSQLQRQRLETIKMTPKLLAKFRGGSHRIMLWQNCRLVIGSNCRLKCSLRLWSEMHSRKEMLKQHEWFGEKCIIISHSWHELLYTLRLWQWLQIE